MVNVINADMWFVNGIVFPAWQTIKINIYLVYWAEHSIMPTFNTAMVEVYNLEIYIACFMALKLFPIISYISICM